MRGWFCPAVIARTLVLSSACAHRSMLSRSMAWIPTADKSIMIRWCREPQPLPLHKGKDQLSIMSWNVNGLRSVLKHDPSLQVLQQLVHKYAVDVICLQETKLQHDGTKAMYAELQARLRASDSVWSCSQSRKGYSGTAVICLGSTAIRRYTLGIGEEEGDLEGRSVTAMITSTANAFPDLSICNVYTPNSGSELSRLKYRVQTWDPAFRSHLERVRTSDNGIQWQSSESRVDTSSSCVQVLVCGDLNVAHLDIDFHNPQDSKTRVQAGTTPEERSSMGTLLSQGYEDLFRAKYPNSTGVYSFWSARARARQTNKGMRLDYFLLSRPEATVLSATAFQSIDCFPVLDVCEPFSDHCPMVCLLSSHRQIEA